MAREVKLVIKIDDRDVDDSTASLRRLEKAAQDVGKNGNLLSSTFSSFSGNFLNDIAQRVVETLKAVAVLLKEAALESIRLAGNFEVTQNAIKVFAGSARLANRELADISQTARDTAGLRLIPAEEGLQRLRGLGFEAERAKKIIKEFSEEKILSGVGDEEFQRVVFNMTQIASGGQKISQEIREMLTAMPSLRRAFLDAFNTLNPQKIQSLLDSNPNAFFDKLISAMEKAKSAQGGLNDAQGKFYDELIRSGREFAQPFLPQLTQSLKELTKDLADNKNVFKSWGESVADGLTFVSRVGETRLFTLGKLLLDLHSRINTFTLTLGVSAGDTASQFGDRVRGYTDYLGITEKGKNYLTGETETDRQAKAALQNAINASEAISEVETNMANQIFEANQKQDRERQKALESLESYYSERLNVIENASKIEEAFINSRQTYTAQDEIQKIRELSSAKSDSIRQQIAEQSAFYNRQIQLSDGSQQEIADITAKRNNTIRNLNAELVINEINAQKQIADKERQIIDQRRKDLVDLKNLQIREVRQSYETQKQDIEKAIENFGKNADELIQVTNNAYIEISRLTRESFDEQLKNQSLTAEQKINLEKQKYLELQDLAKQNSENISRIEEDRHAKTIERIKIESEQISKLYQSRQTFFSSLQNSFFQSSINFGAGIPSRQILGLLGLEGGKQVLDSVQGVLQGNISLYEAQKNILDKTHLLEVTNLKREIDLKKDLIELERVRLKGLIQTNIVNLETQKERAQSNEAKESIQKQIDDWKAVLAKPQNELNNYLDSQSPSIKRYTNDIQDANEALKNLQITQSAENQNLFQNSIEGLKKLFYEIASGQKNFIISQLEENKLWAEKVNIITNIRALEQGYYKDAELWALRRKEQILETERQIWEVKQELAEKGQFNQSESDLKVFQHINSEIKSVSESIADFKISVYDGFTNAILAPFDALQERINELPTGIREVASAFVELARDIVKAFSQKIIMKLLGLDNSSSSGGFNLGSVFNNTNNGVFSGNQDNGSYSFNSTNNSSVYSGLSQQIKSALNNNSNNLNTHESLHSISGLSGGKFNLQSGLALAGVGLSLFGSLLGGKAGSIFSGAGSGLGIGAAIGSMVAPGLGTVVGGLIGAAAGGILGLFGGDPKRRRDKKEKMPQLTQGFADAIAELKQLLADTRSLRVDGDSAISQADEIRKQIAGGFNLTFESKKYRKVAAEQIKTKLIEADDIIKEIKLAAEISKGAADRNKRILPEFANGVYFADYFKPNGLVPGMFDAKDDIFAMISRGEMVLNPKQQAAVRNNAGFDVFQGAGIPNYPSAIKAAVPKMATGGIAGNGFVIKNAAPQPQNMTLELYGVTVNEQVEAYLTSDFGKRTQIKVMKNLKKSGDV